MKTYLAAIGALTIVDIFYTALGAFYGGGGAELNPLFSWVTDPLKFVTLVAIVKLAVLAAIFAFLLWFAQHPDEYQNNALWASRIAACGFCMYFVVLNGTLAANILLFIK